MSMTVEQYDREVWQREHDEQPAREREIARRREQARTAGPTPSEVAARPGVTEAEVAAARDDMLARLAEVDAQIAAEVAERANARRAERARVVEQAEAVARAEQAERLAAEQTAADALPADELSGDELVAEVEQRIASGDESVTADDLAAARTAAAGRSRFARLRQAAADRKARQVAEREQAERIAAAEQAAREALTGASVAEIAARYDEAVAAVRALREAAEVRTRVVVEQLAALREVGSPMVVVDRGGLGYSHSRRLVLDGVTVRSGGGLVDEAIRAALPRHGDGDRTPALVREGREQAAPRKRRGA